MAQSGLNFDKFIESENKNAIILLSGRVPLRYDTDFPFSLFVFRINIDFYKYFYGHNGSKKL